MRNSDPTLEADRTKFGWLRSREGNRKPPPITLPRIRALETPEPNATKRATPKGRPIQDEEKLTTARVYRGCRDATLSAAWAVSRTRYSDRT